MSAMSISNSIGVKLPVISLPKFQGSYEGWLEYRETFESLVHHNEALNPIQRYDYLRASLEGSAALVIKSVEFTAAGYAVAWSIEQLKQDIQNWDPLLIYIIASKLDSKTLVLRFRKRKYVISADCSKMYRQVLVEPKQRNLQKILWRPNPTEDVKCYSLNTVTYGQANASFLAIRCLFEIANECEDSKPDIA
ncbi:hypothetical protein NQ314_021047 [Rhamnusium bicolor]|uniref:Uncharacterized protein n=1 Tax=Rhamnusium bicolor TaxID=1586634 RepID=A0AAV8WJW7_9CUCU|nr:hypothetical protein NQ314_021047 [Rhamnusium bicolor]